jgi:xylulokinase
MMGCVPVDRTGNPKRSAIIWADQRAVAQAQMMMDRIGLENVYSITGHRASPSYSGPKIMWLHAHQPDIFEETYKFLQQYLRQN